MSYWLHIGHHAVVAREKVAAMLPPWSSHVRRLVEVAEREGKLVNATYGRKRKAVLLLDSGTLVLCSRSVNTLAKRAAEGPQDDGGGES